MSSPFTSGMQVFIAPLPAAFVLSLALFPSYIGWLKKKAYGQFIREEGPQSHADKAKTPTMGGLCFIVVTCLVSAAAVALIPIPNGKLRAALVLGVAVLCGLVGFADDFAKVKGQSNKGLSAKARLLMEFGLGLLLSAVLLVSGLPGSSLILHPSGGFMFVDLQLPAALLYLYLFGGVPFLMAATTNALNLHDGMDGLSAGTALQVFLALAVMLLMSGFFSYAAVASAVSGALLGFLMFNRYPAKVFMGDTGSLFLGGLMAALVVASGLTLWFIPLSLIYIAETVSVILQVVYFKITKPYTPEKPMSAPALIFHKLTRRLPGEGKRLFRMAPLHHHFEALAAERGGKESAVVACFWVVQFLICVGTLTVFLLSYR